MEMLLICKPFSQRADGLDWRKGIHLKNLRAFLLMLIFEHTDYSLHVQNNVTVMKSSNRLFMHLNKIYCDNNSSLAFK